MENTTPKNDDELRAENALLRLKLEQEFGMQHALGPMNDPKAENEWLRHIYNIETVIKAQKTIPVYDLIGKPDFKRPEELKPKEVQKELNHVLNLLNDKQILIDTICDYEPIEIYRFIVEDLFPYETDDMPYPGAATWFIYEEFHPNHEHNITSDCGDFVYQLFGEWSDDRFNLIMGDEVLLNDKKYAKSEMKSILQVFAEVNANIEIEEICNEHIQFDLETKKGSYSAELFCSDSRMYSIRFGLEFDLCMWVINSIELPNFNQK